MGHLAFGIRPSSHWRVDNAELLESNRAHADSNFQKSPPLYFGLTRCCQWGVGVAVADADAVAVAVAVGYRYRYHATC
jgi:hypothetical protein